MAKLGGLDFTPKAGLRMLKVYDLPIPVLLSGLEEAYNGAVKRYWGLLGRAGRLMFGSVLIALGCGGIGYIVVSNESDPSVLGMPLYAIALVAFASGILSLISCVNRSSKKDFVCARISVIRSFLGDNGGRLNLSKPFRLELDLENMDANCWAKAEGQFSSGDDFRFEIQQRVEKKMEWIDHRYDRDVGGRKEHVVEQRRAQIANYWETLELSLQLDPGRYPGMSELTSWSKQPGPHDWKVEQAHSTDGRVLVRLSPSRGQFEVDGVKLVDSFEWIYRKLRATGGAAN